ncbi:PfkB family carbohydrate kinase [Agromyces bracchium]|uniref:Ribokinase n=1 Tax=Agromyces bracchium TaxID=88376 RepID=A0A6I3MGG0_9MICO|nr:PfkB family carbohydrate kinase [Agromyces bracchium]MTH69383.1 substrate-binding domain-containing protein [Agromyces bracchium]
MVTRSDVARLAGTSPAVVSYVLNNGPRGVAPETKARVLAAVERLGYRPNQLAVSLRTSETKTIGLVVPDNANPFFAELAREIEKVAFEYGYTLFLANAGDDVEKETGHVRALLDRRVDGVILIPSHDDVPIADELPRAGTPWVVVDRLLGAHRVAPSQVVSNNRQGGRLATEHLIRHGRSRIACISGPQDLRNTADRVRGWRDALLSARMQPTADLLREVSFGSFAAHDAALEMLDAVIDIDAIFVASDEQAIGVMHALHSRGLQCPEDVAMVSFDGIAASELTFPALTTIRQPVPDLARRAFEQLLAQITHTELEPSPQRIDTLDVELIVRGSCGCPAEGARAESDMVIVPEQRDDAGPVVAVVGSMNLDLIVEVDRLPLPGETVLSRETAARPGGKGFNQAVAARRFGGAVELTAAIGADAFGAQLHSDLLRQGLSPAGIRVDRSSPSGVALIVVDSEGQNTISVAAGANSSLVPADLMSHRTGHRQVDVLLLQLEIPLPTAMAAARQAAEAGSTIVLNASPLSAGSAGALSDLIAMSDVLIVNETEAMTLGAEGESWNARAESLLASGPHSVIITLGEEGAVAATADGTLVQPALQVDAIDATGAGDTFCGVLAVALARGDELGEAMAWAAAAGALATTGVGAQTAMPARAEVELFRARRGTANA